VFGQISFEAVQKHAGTALAGELSQNKYLPNNAAGKSTIDEKVARVSLLSSFRSKQDIQLVLLRKLSKNAASEEP
jgi:hypothetical protein